MKHNSVTIVPIWIAMVFCVAHDASARLTCLPAQTCGQVIASYKGVDVFSNAPFQAGLNDCETRGQYGLRYQCVEFVKRFYSQALHVSGAIAWYGNAVDYYHTAEAKGLLRFPNGATAVAPEPDDIMVFSDYLTDTAGHVAIVTGVADGQVNLIEQNFSCTGTVSLALSRDPASGSWRVANRNGMPVLGWLRRQRVIGPSPTFAPKLDKLVGPQPLGLVAADFDGDQRTDIAVTIYNGGNGDHLSILHNVGTVGNPNFDLPIDVMTGRGPEGVAAGDLNNDGKMDLVTANAASLNVSVLRNFSTQGFVDFQPVLPALSMIGTPHRVVVTDFDSDGKPDLIVTSNNGRLVSVFHHASDPNAIAFDYRRDYGVDDYLHDLAVADIDRDTRPEILIPRSTSGLLTIFQNNSTPGNVQAAALTPLQAGTSPIGGVAVADLNNDPNHALDFVVAAIGGLGVFQNGSSPGVFNLSRTDVLTGTSPDAVAIGDLDNDGLVDVVAANPNDDTISVLQNRSAGGPIVLSPLDKKPQTGATPLGLALGDVDGDGWLDIVVANHQGSSISVFLNTTGK